MNSAKIGSCNEANKKNSHIEKYTVTFAKKNRATCNYQSKVLHVRLSFGLLINLPSCLIAMSLERHLFTFYINGVN